MSTGLASRSSTGVDPVRRVPGVWAGLLLAETRGLLLHPATVVTVLLALALWLIPGVPAFPDVTSTSWEVQYTLAVVAGGVFVAANLRALRPYRHRTADFEGVLSLPMGQRTAAALLAPLAPAALALAAGAARIHVTSLRRGATGTVQIGELLTVPAVIVLAGILGHLVAAASRNTAAGLVALVVLGIAGLAGMASAPARWRWFTPVAGEDPFAAPPLPAGLVDRPEWWHLAWLLGLAALAAGGALLLAGAGRVVVPGILVLGVILAGVGGVMQTRPASAEFAAQLAAARDRPSATQVCETRGAATYCAFPEFRGRIGEWARIVEAQDALVPGPAARLTVRQHLQVPIGDQGFVLPLPAGTWAADDRAAGTPDAIPVSTRWAAGGSGGFAESEVIGFSAQVAIRLVTGGPVEAEGPTVCGGRGALIVWLAATATPDTRAALRTLQSHTSGGAGLDLAVLNSRSGLRTGERETALAMALLDADQATVRQLVAEQWSELTAPRTDVDTAAEALGIGAVSTRLTPGGGICV